MAFGESGKSKFTVGFFYGYLFVSFGSSGYFTSFMAMTGYSSWADALALSESDEESFLAWLSLESLDFLDLLLSMLSSYRGNWNGCLLFHMLAILQH